MWWGVGVCMYVCVCVSSLVVIPWLSEALIPVLQHLSDALTDLTGTPTAKQLKVCFWLWVRMCPCACVRVSGSLSTQCVCKCVGGEMARC